MPNRLATESSPYLRQHRENPVDWYPWGPEAFGRAAAEGKPILLSIGYSSCHWCHVMAHESFEDEATARLMNENFVSIKVDREERPDIDAIYMNALQAMTGAGGWPLTMALTPTGEPFFGGTYFPPDDRYGRPSFRRVLAALAAAWEERREEVNASAAQMKAHLQSMGNLGGDGEVGDLAGVTEQAVAVLQAEFDPRNGGFGGAPKFPPHQALRFLLARSEEDARAMALETLRKMARGGIFDQLAGGFARYSVDDEWLVPHFEKMLYDNAQLLSRYAEAYLLTAEPLFGRVLERTVDWLIDEMRAPGGAYYSALDADSEGEEGRFYVWTPEEFRRILGAEAREAMEWFGVTESGNFEGRSVLTSSSPGESASEHRGGEDEARERAESWRRRLLDARGERERPGLDDKVITSWNGLVIGGLADAGRALHRDDYIDRAREAARFLRREVWRDGRLVHVHGSKREIPGLLEDYAYLGLGLFSLYRATFEEEWLLWALDLGDVIVERFRGHDGPFFSTPDDGEALVVRPVSLTDGAVPADNAAAAELLLRKARLTGDRRLEDEAHRAVARVVPLAARHPTGLSSTLAIVEMLRRPPREVAVIGDWRDERTRALLRLVQQQPLSYAVVAHSDGGEGELVRALPFLAGKGTVAGAPAGYVCESGSCRLPVTEPLAFARQLAVLDGG